MLWRAARAAFILYLFVLFDVVLPGHTRGAVTLPGTKGALPACCMARLGADSKSGQAPTPQQQAHCAICFFAARVCQPVTYDFHLTELRLREVLPFPVAYDVVSTSFHATYRGRAPPVL